MKYKSYNFIKLEKEIKDESIYDKCRKRSQDFMRKRKITPKDLIYYSLNNRGETTKMELYDYIGQYGLNDVSDAVLLKRRDSYG